MNDCNYLDTAGGKYFYRVFGRGEPVVLLHCSGGSHRQWDRLVQELAPCYQCYALDFMGYGQSLAFSPWESGNNPDVAAVNALLDRIQQPARIIGHSYGGAIAAATAAKHPQKVKGLCLYEPVLFNLLRDTDDWVQWQTVQQLDQKVSQAIQQNDLTTAARLFVHFWYSKWAWWFMPKAMKNRLTHAMPKISRELSEIHVKGVAESLAHLSVPTSLLYGSRTTVAAKAVVNAFISILPDTEAMELPGLNHLSPATQSGRVNSVFSNCLERLAS